MLILAFDTSVAACSVALCRDGAVVARAREIMDRGQAEALMPMIEQVMEAGHASYRDLDRIAVTIGPGSFTGVRVGLATARGLGLASAKPVVGVLTTEVLAFAVPAQERAGRMVLAAIDTKRGDLYVQRFDRDGRPLSESLAMNPQDLAHAFSSDAIVVVGDGAETAVAALGAHAIVSSADPLPDPALLAQLAANRAPTPPLPVYVHPPAITTAPPPSR